jgi:hypothetical protein
MTQLHPGALLVDGQATVEVGGPGHVEVEGRAVYDDVSVRVYPGWVHLPDEDLLIPRSSIDYLSAVEG